MSPQINYPLDYGVKHIHFYNIFLVRQLACFELKTLNLPDLKKKIKRPFYYHIYMPVKCLKSRLELFRVVKSCRDK